MERLQSAPKAQRRKAWINRILEDNAVPTLWLSNSLGCLDPAFIRRFDILIELPVPPRAQRERIIREACSGLVDTDVVKRLAESEALAPAVIVKAASVMRLIDADIDELGHVNNTVYLRWAQDIAIAHCLGSASS